MNLPQSENLKYRTVVFDLDGTLIDSAPDILDAFNLALQKHGYDQVETQLLEQHVGTGINPLFEQILKPEHHKPVKETFRQNYLNCLCNKTKLYSGMNEVLATLQTKEVTMAILTNKQQIYADPIVTGLGLDMMDVVVGRQTGKKYKPDPEPLWDIMNLTKSRRDQVLMVGDTMTDVLTGQRASIDVCAVTYGYGKNMQSCGAKHVVHNPSELLEVVLGTK